MGHMNQPSFHAGWASIGVNCFASNSGNLLPCGMGEHRCDTPIPVGHDTERVQGLPTGPGVGDAIRDSRIKGRTPIDDPPERVKRVTDTLQVGETDNLTDGHRGVDLPDDAGDPF